MHEASHETHEAQQLCNVYSWKNNLIPKAASPGDAHAPNPATATTPEPCWRNGEGQGTAPSGPIAVCGELGAHRARPAVAEQGAMAPRSQQGGQQGGELVFSHSLSAGPSSPAPGRAGRKPSPSPAREEKRFSFRGKGNGALGTEMPRKRAWQGRAVEAFPKQGTASELLSLGRSRVPFPSRREPEQSPSAGQHWGGGWGQGWTQARYRSLRGATPHPLVPLLHPSPPHRWDRHARDREAESLGSH